MQRHEDILYYNSPIAGLVQTLSGITHTLFISHSVHRSPSYTVDTRQIDVSAHMS